MDHLLLLHPPFATLAKGLMQETPRVARTAPEGAQQAELKVSAPKSCRHPLMTALDQFCADWRTYNCTDLWCLSG